MSYKLILRSKNSPFSGQFTDINLGSVLSHTDLDNNFINLKGNLVYTGDTSGTTLTLYKVDGTSIDLDLSGIVSAGDTFVTGATMSGATLVLSRNDGFSVTTNLGFGTPSFNQYVNVTASTPDNYIGVADPTITGGYLTNVVYAIMFDDTNITTATTINIDGNGVLDLFVPTENGLEGPVPSGLTTGITYFMVYNGDSMQVFDTDPTSSSTLLYTNPAPTPTTIGGILVGSSFSGVTMQEMWDALLYPYLNPAFSSFLMSAQPTSLEIGASVLGGSRTFTWATTFSGNIQANSVKIKNVNTGAIITTPSTGIANDGSEVISIPSVTRTVAGTQTWQISAKNTNNATFTRNFVVNWYNRVYYGTSALTALTASDITGLTSTNLVTTTASATYALGAGNYKYICIPVALTNPTLFRDASTNLTVAMAGTDDGYTILNNGYYTQQVVVTNAFGVNITYDVYRTKNILGGSITIITT